MDVNKSRISLPHEPAVSDYVYLLRCPQIEVPKISALLAFSTGKLHGYPNCCQGLKYKDKDVFNPGIIAKKPAWFRLDEVSASVRALAHGSYDLRRQKSQRMPNRPGKSPQALEPPPVAAEEIQINYAQAEGK